MALSRVKVWASGETLTAADLNAEIQNIIDNATSLISPLGAAIDLDGYAMTLDAAGVTTAQSTSSIGWSFTPGSKSGTPSTTGGISNWAASTWTDSNTAASGTATSWAAHSFQRPTLAASNATVTTTDSATVYIANSPLAGTNETLTNAWALWVDAGNVRLDGDLRVGGDPYWLSSTSFKGTLAHNNAADRTYTFPDADGNIPTIASANEVSAMASTTTALSPNHNKIVLGTYTATTSGTAINITGIPSGVRKVTVSLVAVSTNGTSPLLIQIGDSGGIENTGYTAAVSSQANAGANVATTSTAGFPIVVNNAAADAHHNVAILTLIDSATNTWGCLSTGYGTSGAITSHGCGTKALSDVLDRVTLTAVNGTDTFDAGNLNICYER